MRQAPKRKPFLQCASPSPPPAANPGVRCANSISPGRTQAPTDAPTTIATANPGRPHPAPQQAVANVPLQRESRVSPIRRSASTVTHGGDRPRAALTALALVTSTSGGIRGRPSTPGRKSPGSWGKVPGSSHAQGPTQTNVCLRGLRMAFLVNHLVIWL
jgi:hypothetical protein